MTTAVDNGGGGIATAAANAAGPETHRQSDDDVEARLAGIKSLLDQSSATLKTLHAAVVLSGGRPPAQAELDLAAEARETLAAAARALPPRALLGGGGGGGGGGGEEEGRSSDRLARLATVERTVQNLGMLPPPVAPVPVPVPVAAAAAAAAAGAPPVPPPPRQQQQ